LAPGRLSREEVAEARNRSKRSLKGD